MIKRAVKTLTVLALAVCCLLTLPGCVLVSACANLTGCTELTDMRAYISRQTGADFRGCRVVKDEDTHGGFLGDGESITVLEGNMPEIPASWKSLPLTGQLWEFFYYEEGFGTAGKQGIPAIENGYYWFKNRQDDRADDDENVLDGFSMNFSIALFDADTGILYFYTIDT